MGMTVESCRFLAEACRSGVAPGRVLTLGRQSLWVSPERLVSLLAEAGRAPDTAAREHYALLAGTPRRFEAFLTLLGASEVLAADASAYEGAELIHDFNQPVPPAMEQQFNLILDGGTLEHIFDFPTAIRNCMRMLRVGGRLILFTPANNYFGHGFYQFSPELFYRVLSPESGFEVERLQAMVDTAGFSRVLGVKYAFPITGRRYDVADPRQVKDRVLLVNNEPVLLFIQARRVRLVEPLQTPPQQSDYVGQWAVGTAPQPLRQSSHGGGVAAWLTQRFGERFCRETLPRLAWILDPFRKRRFFRRLSFANRRHFRLANAPSREPTERGPGASPPP
jgi:SAM-dependent methyltransferase